MDQFFYNQLTTLLSVKKNDKFVLNDKNIVKTIELINILFKDVNNMNGVNYIDSILNVELPKNIYKSHFNGSNSKIKNLVKNKKQNKTVELLEYMSSRMIDYIHSITDENNEPLPDDVIDEINLQYDVLFKKMIEIIDADQFIWNQDIFVNAKNKVLEEIIHARFEKRGVNLEPCPVCGCTEVNYTERQIRRADEGTTIFFQCIANPEHKWRRG